MSSEMHEKDMGTFCIVTPTYNMGQYLAATIESVLRNMQPGDEYFIIDGGSTDNTLEIIRAYEKNITGWVSEVDDGYGEALLKGFAKSSSHFLCYINSGDLLLDGALDEARKHLVQAEVDLIFGDDLYIDGNGKSIYYNSGVVSSLKNIMLFGGWTPLQDACFWRRSMYDTVGGVNGGLRYAVDYDLFLRLSLNGKCKYVPIAFSAFLRHDGQKSHKYYKEYAVEREKCRSRELKRMDSSILEICIFKMYYWLLVRLRAYFVAPLLQKIVPVFGVPIKSLKCGTYHVANANCGIIRALLSKLV